MVRFISYFKYQSHQVYCQSVLQSDTREMALKVFQNSILQKKMIPVAHKTFIIKTAFIYASVAQWIRHRPPKPGIAGSSPVGGKQFLLDAFCCFLPNNNSHNLIFCTHHALSHNLEI